MSSTTTNAPPAAGRREQKANLGEYQERQSKTVPTENMLKFAREAAKFWRAADKWGLESKDMTAYGVARNLAHISRALDRIADALEERKDEA